MLPLLKLLFSLLWSHHDGGWLERCGRRCLRGGVRAERVSALGGAGVAKHTILCGRSKSVHSAAMGAAKLLMLVDR